MIGVTVAEAIAVFMCFVAGSLIIAGRSRKPSLLAWTFLGMGLVYGLAWIAVLVRMLNEPLSLEAIVILTNRDYLFVHSLLVVVLACGIVVGWVALSGRKAKIGRQTIALFSMPNAYLTAIAWIFLIVGVVLRWLYVQAFGGFIAYQQYAELIRSGIFEIYNPLSFLQPFGGLVFMASFVFWANVADGHRKLINGIGLTLSFLASIYVLYSLLGRIDFIAYLGTFGVAWLYIKRVRSMKIIWATVIALILGIYIIYWLSQLFGIKAADSIEEFISGEFSFPFLSFFAQWGSGENLKGGFVELLFAPLYLLPSSWEIGVVEGASDINTLTIYGATKGQGEIYGGIPVDLVTLGLMQAHMLGVLIIGAIFGAMLRILDAFAASIPYRGLGAIIFAYIAIRIAFLGVFYAHPQHFVLSNFAFLCLMLAVVSARIVSKIGLKTH